MAKAELKTTATEVSVASFIAAIGNDTRRADAETMVALFGDVTGMNATMWGPSIIGYGRYHYTYESGREGEMCRAGFSPRKANLVLYLTGGYSDPDTQSRMNVLRERLGKHKVGGSRLYINKLSDVDMVVLREMVAIDFAWMDMKYPR